MDEHENNSKDDKKLNRLYQDSYEDSGNKTNDNSSIGGNASSFFNPKRCRK